MVWKKVLDEPWTYPGQDKPAYLLWDSFLRVGMFRLRQCTASAGAQTGTVVCKYKLRKECS
jgi:hypothetical protein